MGIAFLDQCKPLRPYEKLMNYFAGFNMPLDGRSNFTHTTGWIGQRTGTAPTTPTDIAAPTLDLLIADAIGGGSRFQNVDLSSCNQPKENYSARGSNNHGPAETSPIAFYARVFGPDFVDPNKADFKPDPQVMLRTSVLSMIGDQRQQLVNTVGATDKARLDEYFTSIRQLEGQLALQLQKPPPNEACVVPPRLPETATGEGLEIDTVHATHKIMAQLIAMAVACNQTKVFNMVYSDNQSRLRKPGENYYHHVLTHEEPSDPVLGYQPEVHWFTGQSMVALAAFIETFANVREGDGTLLDHMLLMATTESYYARTHTLDGIPLFFVGNAGGRIKTGMHVVGNGMQVMGVPIEKWGTQSMTTSKGISEVLA
jgi:hypothetical protein